MFNVILARFFRKLIRNRKARVLLVGMAALVIILFVSTLGFWFFETDRKLSLFDSWWLSYVTMTTVGYGDLYPTSMAGRILSVFVTMTGGIGVVAYIATFLATTFIEWDNRRLKGLAKVDEHDHFLIVNCPNEDKILTIVEEIRLDKLMKDIPIVLVTDSLEECPQPFVELDDFYFVKGNPLLHRVLEQANAPLAQRAIILARDTKDPNSDGITTQIALTLGEMCRSFERTIHTVAEAVSRDSIEPLHAAGVKSVICLEKIISPVLVQALLNPGVVETSEILSTHREGGQFYVGAISHLEGQTYADIREFFQEMDELRIIPIAIIRDGKPMINPEGKTPIRDGDRLLYISEERKSLRTALAPTPSGLAWKETLR